MFEIGFPELVVVCVVALLVLGPERLPEALRTAGLWFGRLRRHALAVKTEIEREIGMDEVRRQLHNETIVEDIKRLEREAQASAAATAAALSEPARAAPATPKESAPAIAPPNGTAS
jgi:sec-independent protein translocase protein TatB